MLDHVSLRVADYERSKRFYLAALAPLGFTLAMESASGAGFRRDAIPGFWIKEGAPRSSGAPGLRPQYHPNYYGAFVIDPDGYNIEAVCHRAE